MRNFDNLLNNFFFSQEEDFLVNIYENEERYVVEAYLAGIRKEIINVMYNDDILSIYLNTNDDLTYGEYKKIRVEARQYVKMRSFCIPRINLEGSQATFKNGLLTLVLPKQNLVKNNYTIQVE